MSVRTGAEAGAWFRAQVGKDAFHSMCKAFVRTGLNVEPSRSATAIECWNEARVKHRAVDVESIPAFVPVFMNTSASAEHVVFTLGRNAEGKRLCVSTDAGPNRTIGLVQLGKLAASWGPVFGWTEDFDGQRIWTPPAPAPAKPTAPAEPLAHVHLMNRWITKRELDLNEISTVQMTGREPYAAAADVLHDKVQAAMREYAATTSN